MESTRHTMFLDYYNLLEAAQKALVLLLEPAVNPV